MGVENHKVNIVRIAEIKVHPNADSLSLIEIGGYQVVVKIGQFKVGDLAVYIQPDSVVPMTEPFKFIWENYVQEGGTVPEKRRRVTVRKFRKEWSEGLLMPMSDFFSPVFSSDGTSNFFTSGYSRIVCEGDDVAEILGIAHYNPPEPIDLYGGPSVRQSKRFPRSFKGWLYFLVRVLSFGYFDLNGPTGGSNEKAPNNTPPVYDVEALKNYSDVLQQNEDVIITEKIHGSNIRFTFQDSLTGGHMYVGSRNLWKAPQSKCIWRRALASNPWIEEWCRQHPGYTLYGEVVPTQDGGYDYGFTKEVPGVFLFDVRSPEGEWMPYEFTGEEEPIPPMGISVVNWVPILIVTPFDLDYIKKNLLDGKSTVFGATNIREGVVIRPIRERHAHGLGRVQLKLVSNAFLEKDSK